MHKAEKIIPENATQKSELGRLPEVILPKNVHQNGKLVDKTEPILPENANKNGEFVRIPDQILPKNEGQVRPLINKLKHNGERIKVWCEVVGTGEKINFQR